MASGLPDYQQTVRQRYGAALEVRGGIVALPSFRNELASVKGKGIIYGGAMWVQGFASQFRGVPSLSVEGVDIGESPLHEMNELALTGEKSAPLHLLKYDDVNFLYTMGVMPGITFETGFNLFYKEVEGDVPGVGFFIFYALV